MAKLNGLVAVMGHRKAAAKADLTAAHHKVQKPDATTGLSRVYRPKDDEGEQLPAEGKIVQYTVAAAIRDARAALTSLFDSVAAVDRTNCSAVGDIVVDDKLLLAQVPVAHLLFLEKQLVDMHTFVAALPVLDPAEQWTSEADSYKSAIKTTVRTKKIPRNHVKAEATDKHPAQVDVYTEDVVVGYWDTRQFSGAIPAAERQKYLSRLKKLQEAVKFAREAANNTEVVDFRTGQAIMSFVFDE